MGRNAAKELVRITRTIGAYLDQAEQDAALSLTYEGIERATGVSRGHLSRRQDPEILALVARIATIKETRRTEASVTSSDPTASVAAAAPAAAPAVAGALRLHGEEALGKLIQRELRELARLQEQWTSRHARSAVHDAPLALYDADELLRRLRAAVERVRPLVAEWTRRHGITATTDTAPAPSDALTFLTGVVTTSDIADAPPGVPTRPKASPLA